MFVLTRLAAERESNYLDSGMSNTGSEHADSSVRTSPHC